MTRDPAAASTPRLAGVEVVVGNAADPSLIRAALSDVDVVIHLAGHSGAASSASDPVFDLTENVGGLITLLEAVRAQERSIRVVFPGSRLEYGRVRTLPVLESDPIRPVSPYGANKYACELYFDLYARMYGISYAVARLTNPYGPSETPANREYNVINRLIAAARLGETITVYGEGKQLRDYVFVEDAVEALALLAARADNVVANVGSGKGIAFLSAVQTIVRIAGRGEIVFAPWPPAAERVETGDFVADITHIRSLGWEPRTAFEDGVTATIQVMGQYA